MDQMELVYEVVWMAWVGRLGFWSESGLGDSLKIWKGLGGVGELG